MESRDTHARKLCHFLDSEGPGVVLPDPLHRPHDVIQAAIREAQLTDEVALFAGHQSPENLALKQRGQCLPVPRLIEQAQQPHDGIEQLVPSIADRDSRPCGARGSRQVPRSGLQQQLRYDGRFESHPKTES
jgi:hypothetical protein